jgi:HEPN domain-containing protein
MDHKEIIDYWVTEAEESLIVAEHLFEKRDFSYSLFFGHLAVEKRIKAILVKNGNPQVHRTHNLLRLAKAAQIRLNDAQQSSLVRITAFNLETRYPDYKKEFRKKCTQQFTRMELEKIREVAKWLKSKL